MLLPLFGAVLLGASQTFAHPIIDSLTKRDPVNTDVLIFGGCTADQESKIKQAYIDAIGNFGQVLGHFPQLDWDGDTLLRDYFGKETDSATDRGIYQQRIVDNFIRIFAPHLPFRTGDPSGASVQMRCDDIGNYLGSTCTMIDGQPIPQNQQPTAYQVGYGEGPNGKQDPAFINFCPRFFDDSIATFQERWNDIDADRSTTSTFPIDNVMSFYGTAPQIVLHELFHLEYSPKSLRGNALSISDPRCLDRKVGGKFIYGPAASKYLARITAGGLGVASINNDNYVYFLIAKYMTKTWLTNGAVADKPKYKRPALKKRQVDLDDDESETNIESPTDDDLPEEIADQPTEDDDSVFYAADQTVTPGAPSPQCAGTDVLSTNQQYVADTIVKYCDYVDSINANLSCAAPYAPIGYQASDTDSTNTLWLTAQWDEGKCQGQGPFAIRSDDCNSWMSAINGGCSNSDGVIFGGSLETECINWNIQLVIGSDSTPPAGFDAENSVCH